MEGQNERRKREFREEGDKARQMARDYLEEADEVLKIEGEALDRLKQELGQVEGEIAFDNWIRTGRSIPITDDDPLAEPLGYYEP